MAIPSKQPIKNQPAVQTANNRNTATRPAKTIDNGLVKEQPGQFPLARKNFIMMIAAGLLIIIGFMLMLGGGSTPEKFNPDIFGARRIIVGPTLAFLGFVFMGVAIILKPGKNKKAGSTYKTVVDHNAAPEA